MNLTCLLCIGWLTALFAGTIFAEPLGTTFTYQGELQQLGDPADGAFDFQFDLYDIDIGGIALTAPMQLEDVNVNEGVFTVELDFGSSPFTGAQLWLEIGVRDGGTTGPYTILAPRSAIRTTVFAIWALTAESVPVDSITSTQIDSSSVQERVGGACSNGSSIKTINPDGTVACQPVPTEQDCPPFFVMSGIAADGSLICTDFKLFLCGNGVLNAPEECDDGNQFDDDGCSAACELECGNGELDGSEVCDDGNMFDGDGCSATCQSDESCGNSVVDVAVGEVCDDGNMIGGDGCSANCSSDETCGNGVVDAGEACDDGNNENDDGCSSACQIE